MTLSKTIEELKADLARMKAEGEARDMERGYCTIPLEKYYAVSDYWGYECYNRHWKRLKPLLLDYATIVLQADEFMAIGKDDELKAIAAELEIASYVKDTVIKSDATFLAHVFIKPMIEGQSKLDPAKYAQMIERELKGYPYSICTPEAYDDGYKSGEQGDYDAYYTMKMEEYKKWQNVH